jgi:hypothetical protein
MTDKKLVDRQSCPTTFRSVSLEHWLIESLNFYHSHCCRTNDYFRINRYRASIDIRRPIVKRLVSSPNRVVRHVSSHGMFFVILFVGLVTSSDTPREF